MRKPAWIGLALAILFSGTLARATIFGTVRGIVHDPQHRPMAGATVTLKSATSSWSKSTQTDQDGAFTFTTVPVGDYTVSISKSGFADVQQTTTVLSDTSPVLHFQLRLAALSSTTTVTAESQEQVGTTDSVTPTTLLARQDIAETPGADRTNSLAMITDYVPAAYVTHDMLHIRGDTR